MMSYTGTSLPLRFADFPTSSAAASSSISSSAAPACAPWRNAEDMGAARSSAATTAHYAPSGLIARSRTVDQIISTDRIVASRGSENALPPKLPHASSLPVAVLGDVTNTAGAGFKPALGGLAKPPPAPAPVGQHSPRSASAASLAPEDLDEDPQKCGEYVRDIFRNLQRDEARQLPQLGYMENQPVVNSKMRAILVDWLVDVHKKYKLREETLFLTVSLLDRFLEKRSTPRQRLQLVGVASLLIAAKFEEIYPPEISKFVEVTDKAYTRDEILRMEMSILIALDFQVCRPTSLHFLERYQCLNDSESSGDWKASDSLRASTRYLAQYLLELTLVDYKMLKHTPSHLAAAALLLSNKLDRRTPAWNGTKMLEQTKMTEQMLKECAKEICGLLEAAEESKLQAVRKKYSQAKYNAVATTEFQPALRR